MSFLEHIDKVKERTFLLGVLGLVFLVVPGIAYIAFFRGDLLVNLDVMKLTLLALALDIPFFLVSFVGTISQNSPGPGYHSEEAFGAFVLAAIISGLTLYFSLAISYLFGLHFKIALLMTLVIVFVVFLAFASKAHKPTAKS